LERADKAADEIWALETLEAVKAAPAMEYILEYLAPKTDIGKQKRESGTQERNLPCPC